MKYHSAENLKIVFSNQLRGLAVISVMLSHLIGVYWTKRDVIAAHIWAPLLPGTTPDIVNFIVFKYFNFGQFGVALFFLISGFVIPFSIGRLGSLQFLIARIFRIYPTYIFAFLLAVGVTWLSAHYWGVDFNLTSPVFISNVVLANRMLGLDSIDLVNWTLQIEIKFYLLMMMLPFITPRFRIVALIAIALLIAIFNYSLPPGKIIRLGSSLDFSASMFGVELLFVVFMFIGVAFHFLFQKTISTTGFIIATLALLILFSFSWKHSLISYQFFEMTLNYFYALIAFGIAYLLRSRFTTCRPLDFMADISYPLYIIHSLIGYTGIRLLTSIGMSYYLALPVMFVIVCLIAYIIHKVVEMPTYLFGKGIASKFSVSTGNEVNFS